MTRMTQMNGKNFYFIFLHLRRLWIILPACLLTHHAVARTLEVGQGREYERPSAAAAAAQDGDTVSIAAGEYYDCSVWRADHLTLVGEGEVTITDAVCEGKAAFVIPGNAATVRNIGFARLRAPDDNGAGIRGEGRDLTVEDSRFANTQMGILAASPGGGALRVVNCQFSEIGSTLTGRTNFAVRATGFDLVRVERSAFEHARGGADISVDGAHTEIVGNRMADEGGHMAGPMVLVQGGALLLEGNGFDLAAGAAVRPGVVLALGDDMAALAVRGNTLRDAGATGTPLVRNWSGVDATETGNIVPAGTDAVTESGSTWHLVRAAAAEMRDTLKGLLSEGRHLAGAVLQRLR
jgi:hypothetical protein